MPRNPQALKAECRRFINLLEINYRSATSHSFEQMIALKLGLYL